MNIIRVSVDNPDDLLATGAYGAGAIVRLQSGAAEAGPFANESTAAIVTATRIYTLYDADGATATWYQTRYENAAGTLLSDWTPAFQAGGEEGGYLCSLSDVKQRLGIASTNTASDEDLLDLIRAVSSEIERVTGCDFTGDVSDTVYTFDVRAMSSVLTIDRGIQSVTTLELATVTGGAYTATSNYYLRPQDRDWVGEPAHRIELYQEWFYPGFDTVQLTGKLGWAVIPPEVSRIAQSAVVAQHMTKGSEGPRAVVGPDGRATILRDISPADWEALMRFQAVMVG